MFSNSIFVKRTLALLAATALLASFASCGSDDKTNSSSKKNTGSVSRATRAADNPNIIEFDDSEEEDDGGKKTNSSEDEVFTTTTTTAPSKTKKTTTTASTTTKKTTTTTTTTKAAVTTAATQPAPQLSNKYKVGYKTYSSDNGKCTYKYPQITGLYDEAMQSFYNSYFKNNSVSVASDTGLSNFSGVFEVKYKTKDTLSIIFRESYTYSGAAHGYSCAYAITIDLATGNTVVPSESVDIDKATEAIKEKSWTLTRAVAGVTRDDVIKYFNQFDEDTVRDKMTIDDMITVKNTGGKYTVKGKTGCNSYFDVNGDPVLILEVNHALGDYVEVQF